MKTFSLFLFLLVAVITSCTRKSDYYVCAFVWPSCHDDSLAHKWLWPDGEGEWRPEAGTERKAKNATRFILCVKS